MTRELDFEAGARDFSLFFFAASVLALGPPIHLVLGAVSLDEVPHTRVNVLGWEWG
jgi:hypothetical protein